MDLIKQKGKKVGPVEDILHKFKYSFQGIAYCYTHESSFIFESLAVVAAIILGFVFNIKPHYWVISLISLLNIMEIEFLNTAVEATVDMYTKEFNPFAKIAKDCGSAATFVATTVAVITHIYIYGYVYILPLILK